jgi:hypothetical protein
MKDRLVAGSLDGVIGAFIQELYAIILKTLEFSDRTFGDLAFILVSQKYQEEVLLVKIIANAAIGLFFGAVFAYILMLTTSRYYLLKGIFYGVVLWLILSGFGVVFDLPKFKDTPPDIALVTLIGSIIYGVVTAYTLKLLDTKTKIDFTAITPVKN